MVLDTPATPAKSNLTTPMWSKVGDQPSKEAEDNGEIFKSMAPVVQDQNTYRPKRPTDPVVQDQS